MAHTCCPPTPSRFSIITAVGHCQIIDSDKNIQVEKVKQLQAKCPRGHKAYGKRRLPMAVTQAGQVFSQEESRGGYGNEIVGRLLNVLEKMRSIGESIFPLITLIMRTCSIWIK